MRRYDILPIQESRAEWEDLPSVAAWSKQAGFEIIVGLLSPVGPATEEEKSRWEELQKGDDAPEDQHLDKSDQERHSVDAWRGGEHGQPSASNAYLFNGDIADRGRNALEILLLLLCYQLADPRCVHINRGNHEQRDLNERPFAQVGACTCA